MPDPNALPEVQETLAALTAGVRSILKDNLIGIYLFGSLVVGDFKANSSDLDITVIVKSPLNSDEVATLKKLHQTLQSDHHPWGSRLECSYTPEQMLVNIAPPLDPRAYVNNREFYEAAPYGNEWLINNYLLLHHSQTLLGPNFQTLLPDVPILEVQKACIRELLQEWLPKAKRAEWLAQPYCQVYLVLNLCRIMYTVVTGKLAGKKVSALWVKQHYSPNWHSLITEAQSWEFGKRMQRNTEVREFIDFVINEVKHTEILG